MYSTAAPAGHVAGSGLSRAGRSWSAARPGATRHLWLSRRCGARPGECVFGVRQAVFRRDQHVYSVVRRHGARFGSRRHAVWMAQTRLTPGRNIIRAGHPGPGIWGHFPHPSPLSLPSVPSLVPCPCHLQPAPPCLRGMRATWASGGRARVTDGRLRSQLLVASENRWSAIRLE